jgi:Cu(I)/Ag(I) efflux system protein CusF
MARAIATSGREPADAVGVSWKERNRRTNMRKTMMLVMALLGLVLVPITVSAQQGLADGEVVKVDQSAGKITIKHGPMKKLNMDEGMTMVFKAQDPAMLKQVKQGDKVKFDAENVNGQFTVTKIEKKK